MRLVILISLGTAIFLSACTDVSKQVITRKITIEPAEPMSLAKANRLSEITIEGVRKIKEARTAIDQESYQVAKLYLEAARSLFAKVKDEMPSTKIHDQIWVRRKELTYDTETYVKAEVVPIIRSKYATEIVQSEISNSAKGKTLNGVKTDFVSQAIAYLFLTPSRADYDNVGVNLGQVEKMILAAERALEKKDYKRALIALRNESWLMKTMETATFEWPAHKEKDVM